MLVIKENIDDFLDENFTLDFSSKHMTEILQQCESINNLFINDEMNDEEIELRIRGLEKLKDKRKKREKDFEM